MLVYLLIISFIAVIITVYDKWASKKKKRKRGKKRKKRTRVPEKVLWFVAVIGGAVAEYITMRLIRHKTKHKEFMKGLPLIIIVHAALFIAYYFIF